MFFVTGTDTGVGKTYFSCMLIRELRASGIHAVGFKPLCCGDRDDAIQLAKASDDAITINECNPTWMRFPASPYAASIIEERLIDLQEIRSRWQQMKERFPAIVVEGAGGWLVPIHRDYSMADLAREMGLPVIVVAANRLGVLNHTLLTVQAIQAANLTCAGIVLNNGIHPTNPVSVTNRSILEELLRGSSIPILGELEADSTHLPATIAKSLLAHFPTKNRLPETPQ